MTVGNVGLPTIIGALFLTYDVNSISCNLNIFAILISIVKTDVIKSFRNL